MPVVIGKNEGEPERLALFRGRQGGTSQALRSPAPPRTALTGGATLDYPSSAAWAAASRAIGTR